MRYEIILGGAALVALCDLAIRQILRSIGNLGIVAGITRVAVDSVVAGVIASQIATLGGIGLTYYITIVSLYFFVLLMAE